MSNRKLRGLAPEPETIIPFKVGVAFPSTGHVVDSFAFDLANMIGFTAATRNDIQLRLWRVRGSLLPHMRESMTENLIRAGCTHILMLDSDMRFPKNTLVRLLEHNLPVVAANYTRRGQPHYPVAISDLQNAESYVYTFADSTGLEPVAAVGFGVMLVQTDFVRTLPQPRFAVGWDTEHGGYLGEDAFFCMRCAEGGFTPVIDQDLSKEVKHSGEHEFGYEEALLWRQTMEQDAEPAEPAEPVPTEA